MTYIYCKTCNKRFKKTNNHYVTKRKNYKINANCATCIRRLREGGHIIHKGPAGPGGRGKKKKKGAKRTSNSIPRAPQGDE